MAEVLGVISSVIALVDALRQGGKLVASVRGAREAFIHLHNELTSVSRYLHQVHDTLNDLPPEPSGSSASLDYVKRVADALVTDLAELQQLASAFEADANGKVDAHGRPKIPKLKWTWYRDSIETLRERISQKRTDLAHALSVLQTKQGTRTTSLVIEFVELSTQSFGNITTSTQRTETAIGELQTRMGDLTRSWDERESRLHAAIAGIRKTLQEPSSQLRTEDPPAENLERAFQCLVLDTKRNPGTNNRHESRQSDNTLLTVHTTLSSGRRCNASCTCQCHRSSRAGTPGLLSNLVGKLLISYNGIPGWKPRTCNHPGCLRKSPNQAQLSYLFPRWMLRKALSVVLSWDSMTGSGASLHLTVPRVIGDDHLVWVALAENDVVWLQTKMAAREVFPTDVDSQGQSLIIYALSTSLSYEVCSYLLTDYPVSAMSWQDRYGRTLAYGIHSEELAYSMVADFPAICRALDLTEDDRFSTPIIDAVRGIDGTSLDIALDMNPSSINDRDATGRTALHWAAKRGDVDAVRVLLSYKADPSAKDLSGYTPLHFAAECHDSSIMQSVLAAGSDLNARSHDGYVPLVYAVQRVARDNVVALLQAGSKADASNNDGQNAFHLVARDSALTGHTSNTEEDMLQIFQSLIEYGGDPNKIDPQGHRPLDLAIVENNNLVFRVLCRLGVELDYLNKYGWTILHWAAGWARSELLAALLEMEISTVDPVQADLDGWTPTQFFWSRLDLQRFDLAPTQSRPTEEEMALFERLVTEMEDRYHGFVYSDSEERELSGCSDSEEDEWLDAEETP